MANACIEIETTRDIGRQILRHRSFVFQEFSQRFAEPTQMQFEKREARLQDKKNKQGSLSTNDARIKAVWSQMQDMVIASAWEYYSKAVALGIAKEQARAILPEGCTPSRIYMNGSLRSWIHYIELRTKWDTQKEHREVALACADSLRPIFPMIDEFVSNDEQPKG